MSAIDLTHTSDEEDGEARREAPPPAKRRRTGGGASSESAAATVDLTDDEPLVAATGAKKADDKPPPWLVQQGVRRIMAEFRALTEALEARPGSLGALRRLWLPDDDNLLVWRMECSGFDEDLQGGRDINADLASLSRQTGGRASSIVMEATFPKAYPRQPFFLRVVTPRMVMYTGHGPPLALSLPPHVCRPSVCLSLILTPSRSDCGRLHLRGGAHEHGHAQRMAAHVHLREHLPDGAAQHDRRGADGRPDRDGAGRAQRPLAR